MTYVLIVVAHPDDAEIAMGMRIRAYADAGARIRVHCLSTGTPGPTGAAERPEECRAAAAVLGVDAYTFADIPDNQFVERRVEINAGLFEVFAEGRPDIVYTHFPDDQHLDHSITAQEVTTVALREANDLCYLRSPYSVGFEPNKVFVGTKKLLQAKDAALKCFASQSQLDMDAFLIMAAVAHRQYVHHRVVERFPPGSEYTELFRTARQIEFAGREDLPIARQPAACPPRTQEQQP
ncbi:PIG-L deacetylase family protein [Streptomyces sp. NBC_01304]|uniref:PIG-L deacetylase family protein n=1 Tax=Streptomyces sp. NBC_01304 TaxID=2903818 RepID=UPI002E13350D|nr:PIG-L family deacetylase [Streptomyces sp. NBC_01304]